MLSSRRKRIPHYFHQVCDIKLKPDIPPRVSWSGGHPCIMRRAVMPGTKQYVARFLPLRSFSDTSYSVIHRKVGSAYVHRSHRDPGHRLRTSSSPSLHAFRGPSNRARTGGMWSLPSAGLRCYYYVEYLSPLRSCPLPTRQPRLDRSHPSLQARRRVVCQQQSEQNDERTQGGIRTTRLLWNLPFSSRITARD